MLREKPGAPTEGRPSLESVHALSQDGKTTRQLAASLDAPNSQLIALILVRATKDKGLPLMAAAKASSLPGASVPGNFEGRRLEPGMREAAAALKAEGIRLVRRTGAHHATADAVTSAPGSDGTPADMHPEDVQRHVLERQRESRRAGCAGDGGSDAPVSGLANIGIAMGNGSDTAMQSEGVVVNGDLRGSARTVCLIGAAMKNIRQNLFSPFM